MEIRAIFHGVPDILGERSRGARELAKQKQDYF
jgi:hypothetical protein